MSKLLIHIGIYKAGSSFLADWFDNNPYLHSKQKSFAGFNSETDIINFVDNNTHNNIKYFVLRDIQFTFTNPYLIKKGLSYYDFRNNLFTLFKETFNHPKVLLILRGKNSFLKSAYSQYIREGGHLSAEILIGENKEFLNEFFNYDLLIEDCIKIFGKENLLVLPFELLAENSNKFISLIENNFEIPHFEYNPKVKNKSLSASELYWQHKYSKITFNILSKFGKPGSFLIKSYYNHIKRKSSREKLPLTVKIINSIFPTKSIDLKLIENPELKIIFDNIQNFNTFTKYSSLYK